eukprot:c9419_g1_i3.p1 GENE.c9419_g1_i3~~c9419_g1_i3.p1  ORF type:complete len:103 (+),score=23.40 c9419_g1_i3:74-382(+)
MRTTTYPHNPRTRTHAHIMHPDDESAHAMPEASSIFRPYSHDFPMSLSNLTSSKHNSSHSSSLLDSSNMSNSSDLSNSSSTNSNISNVMHTNNGVIESILPV